MTSNDFSNLYIKLLLGLSHKNKAWRRRGSLVLKMNIKMLIKQPRSKRQKSETLVKAQLQIIV